MSNQTIDDLRKHLFTVLEGLADKEKPMDLERAKATCEVAQTIINGAKVQVDYLRVTKGGSSPFLEPPPALPTTITEKPAEPGNGIVGVTRHLIGD